MVTFGVPNDNGSDEEMKQSPSVITGRSMAVYGSNGLGVPAEQASISANSNQVTTALGGMTLQPAMSDHDEMASAAAATSTPS